MRFSEVESVNIIGGGGLVPKSFFCLLDVSMGSGFVSMTAEETRWRPAAFPSVTETEAGSVSGVTGFGESD